MALLVDYKCKICSGRAEHWTSQPIPDSRPCAACGGEARRLFAVARLSRGGNATSSSQPSLTSPQDAAAACLQNSRAPGACHMHPSAARRWSAMGRGDTQAVEREIEHQEKAIKAGTLAPNEAFTHTHAGAAAHQHPAGES